VVDVPELDALAGALADPDLQQQVEREPIAAIVLGEDRALLILGERRPLDAALFRWPDRPRRARRAILPQALARETVLRIVIPEKTHKSCTHCQQWLPFDAFAPNPKLKSGRDSWCRKCRVTATQDWRARNRDEINRARREAYGSTKPHKYPKTRKATA